MDGLGTPPGGHAGNTGAESRPAYLTITAAQRQGGSTYEPN
jgi:hypothetical protein